MVNVRRKEVGKFWRLS